MPLPTALRDHLDARLPRADNLPANVKVIPRDRHERRCAAYDADHYEVAAFYSSFAAPLGGLFDALASFPGVYRVTALHAVSPDRDLRDPGWPVRYRAADQLRPQVRALFRATP